MAEQLAAVDIAFAFANRPPLFEGVNLAVRAGECVGLIGANGSGKTTLARILAGMLMPQRGEVFIDGEPVTAVRRQVSILFQNPDHQMIAATVEEEIALGLELRGTEPSVMQSVVAEMLHRFGLEEMRLRAPESLSGGQKQRVALAAVMTGRPRFLLLDEPDSYLDAPSRRDFLNALDTIRAEVGIVWVAPSLRSLPPVARAYFLDGGTVSEWRVSDLQAHLSAVARA